MPKTSPASKPNPRVKNMPLKEKAKGRSLGKKKAPAIIIGDSNSAPAFTKAPIITIDSSKGPRGGKRGSTIGARPMAPRGSRSRIGLRKKGQHDPTYRPSK